MKESRGIEQGPKKGMTRGEFLTVGGAAAVGGVVGGVGPGLDGDAQEQICAGNCDPEGAVRWQIPAGVLNALWGDVLPRLVARAWLEGRTLAGTSQGIGLNLEITAPYLLDDFGNLVPRTPLAGTAVFANRLNRVTAFLNSNPTFPLWIVGHGGFDFTICDKGIFFYLPEKPDLRELIRFYTYRRTGRRPIGLPHYLDQGNGAMATDSPTGPGQLIVSNSMFDSLVAGAPAACAAELERCRDRFPTMETVIVGEPGSAGEREGFVTPNTLDRGFRLSIETFECLMAPLLCWYVSGAVYRGIMTELPRVVANIWLERVDGVTSAAGTYDERFMLPGDAGLRSIFQERIETSLHDDQSMAFRVVDPAAPPFPVWTDDTVWITDRGFFFPKIDDLGTITADLNAAQTPATAWSDEEAMFFKIAQGLAGNPVFTDSMKTE